MGRVLFRGHSLIEEGPQGLNLDDSLVAILNPQGKWFQIRLPKDVLNLIELYNAPSDQITFCGAEAFFGRPLSAGDVAALVQQIQVPLKGQKPYVMQTAALVESACRLGVIAIAVDRDDPSLLEQIELSRDELQRVPEVQSVQESTDLRPVLVVVLAIMLCARGVYLYRTLGAKR